MHSLAADHLPGVEDSLRAERELPETGVFDWDSRLRLSDVIGKLAGPRRVGEHELHRVGADRCRVKVRGALEAAVAHGQRAGAGGLLRVLILTAAMTGLRQSELPEFRSWWARGWALRGRKPLWGLGFEGL